ncbi:hypothetical protein ACFLYQ_00185 [Chloroflexota bacterium]
MYSYFKDLSGTEGLDRGGYFDMTPIDTATDIRRDTVPALEELGVAIEYSHHEVAPSQYEMSEAEKEKRGISTLPASLLEAVLLTEKSELMRKAPGDHVFEAFIRNKKIEWEQYST